METIQPNKTKTINKYHILDCDTCLKKWAFSMSKGVRKVEPNLLLFYYCLSFIVVYCCIKQQ